MSVGDPWSGGSAHKELDDGYFVIYHLNFNHFGWKPEFLPYRVLGLDVMLDNASDGLPASTVVWQGTKDNGTDPSQFGTVVLKPEE